LQELIEQKLLPGDIFVWNKTMNSWQMAKSLDQFPTASPAESEVPLAAINTDMFKIAE
jgi:hypothetical protein